MKTAETKVSAFCLESKRGRNIISTINLHPNKKGYNLEKTENIDNKIGWEGMACLSMKSCLSLKR